MMLRSGELLYAYLCPAANAHSHDYGMPAVQTKACMRQNSTTSQANPTKWMCVLCSILRAAYSSSVLMLGSAMFGLLQLLQC
jgi:hypothetical protein